MCRSVVQPKRGKKIKYKDDRKCLCSPNRRGHSSVLYTGNMVHMYAPGYQLSLSLSLSLLPPTAPSSGRPNNNIPGHQGEQQVHAARWDAELCFRRGYTKIEKYSVSPAPSKAPAHSSLHIRSLRHTHTQATPAQTGTAPPPCVRDEGVLLAQANVWANERAHQEKELSIARTGGT